jgi:hypothetical protein
MSPKKFLQKEVHFTNRKWIFIILLSFGLFFILGGALLGPSVLAAPFLMVFVLFIFVLPFAVNFVHHIVVVLAILILRVKYFRKWFAEEKIFSLVTAISYFLAVVIFFVSMYACDVDYSCRTSDAPLGSAGAWILWFFISHLLFMYPFNKFMTKLPSQFLIVPLFGSILLGIFMVSWVAPHL